MEDQMQIAKKLYEAQDYRAAIRMWEDILPGRDTYEIRSYLGAAYAQVKDYNKSEEHFRAAVAFRPESAQGHYNLARLCVAQSRISEAADCLEAAIRIRPDYNQASEMLRELRGMGKMGTIPPVPGQDEPNSTAARPFASAGTNASQVVTAQSQVSDPSPPKGQSAISSTPGTPDFLSVKSSRRSVGNVEAQRRSARLLLAGTVGSAVAGVLCGVAAMAFAPDKLEPFPTKFSGAMAVVIGSALNEGMKANGVTNWLALTISLLVCIPLGCMLVMGWLGLGAPLFLLFLGGGFAIGHLVCRWVLGCHL